MRPNLKSETRAWRAEPGRAHTSLTHFLPKVGPTSCARNFLGSKPTKRSAAIEINNYVLVTEPNVTAQNCEVHCTSESKCQMCIVEIVESCIAMSNTKTRNPTRDVSAPLLGRSNAISTSKFGVPTGLPMAFEDCRTIKIRHFRQWHWQWHWQ